MAFFDDTFFPIKVPSVGQEVNVMAQYFSGHHEYNGTSYV
jgi:hypothetical protein